MDKLAAMRTYVTIVDKGSLTRAAVALNRSLPTVVRVLAALEEDLGVRLLRRSTRRMSLTAEGHGYLERCRRILADIEDAEQSVVSGQQVPSGEVRVTAPVLFGTMHVAPAVTLFARECEQVKVELLLLDRVVNLIEEGIDIAVRIAPLTDSSMIAIPVGSIRRVACASPVLLEQIGRPAHPSQLGDRPCVHFFGVTTGEGWGFRENGRDFQVHTHAAFACNHAAAAAEACAAGLGFGWFLSYQIAPLIRDGRLEVILSDYERPAIPLCLVYPESRLMTARMRALIDWLRPALSDVFGSDGRIAS